MKREIKFRAYSKVTERMMDWEFISKVGNLNKIIRLAHVVVLQYTGLKDKNGKEIYADDLLKDQYGVVFRVYSIPGGFAYKESVWQKDTKKWSGIDLMVATSFAQGLSYIQQSCEVIGNIYENPELL